MKMYNIKYADGTNITLYGLGVLDENLFIIEMQGGSWIINIDHVKEIAQLDMPEGGKNENQAVSYFGTVKE